MSSKKIDLVSLRKKQYQEAKDQNDARVEAAVTKDSEVDLKTFMSLPSTHVGPQKSIYDKYDEDKLKLVIAGEESIVEKNFDGITDEVSDNNEVLSTSNETNTSDAENTSEISGQAVHESETIKYNSTTSEAEEETKAELDPVDNANNVRVENKGDHAVDKIINFTTGMDIFKLDINKLHSAPADWNFYAPLPEAKMKELIESIINNGLLVPVIVWQVEEEKFMILSGHNRVEAFRRIYDVTKDDRFKKIHAFVKKSTDIDIEAAKQIIIDTNFVQRELSPSEKAKSILEKYRFFGRKEYGSVGKNTADMIAESLNISYRTVQDYYKLNNLIDELMQLVDDQTLSITSGIMLASLKQDFQRKLVNEYGVHLTNKKIAKLNINRSEENIIKQLTGTSKEMAVHTIKVPKDKSKEFRAYVDLWLKENAL